MFHSLQSVHEISITPFEKNLELWKQLWRVIEKRFFDFKKFQLFKFKIIIFSDVIVQIVDARNPLLFRCEDLEVYVKEVDNNKINLLLINKSDLLNKKQRIEWYKYFEKINCKVVFWSAKEVNHQNENSFQETNEYTDLYVDKCKILTREELITLFKTFKPGSTAIGMVGLVECNSCEKENNKIF